MVLRTLLRNTASFRIGIEGSLLLYSRQLFLSCSCIFVIVTDIVVVAIVDHPRSDVVYNFGRVCNLYFCQTITFGSLDVGNSFSHIQCICREYGSSSYMKIIGSRSRSITAIHCCGRGRLTPCRSGQSPHAAFALSYWPYC